MKKLEEKILKTINEHSLISGGETVIVAVSGGADSMSLLRFFNKFSTFLNINTVCAHVNHMIRGEEAKRDENFVRSFCSEHSIEFRCAEFDVPNEAQRLKISQELCGRKLRYSFFESIDPLAKVATAHNLNDSIETFFFNLSRGTGLKGLTGIPYSRDNIIRPLLDCTRNEIEEYLMDEQISFVTDSTNLIDNYSRNKIRHGIIPVLMQLNPAFETAFSACSEALNASENYINNAACLLFDTAFADGKLDVGKIKNSDIAIKNRVIIKFCEKTGAEDISSRHVDLISEMIDTSGAVMLPGGIKIVSDGNNVFVGKNFVKEEAICVPLSAEISEYNFSGIDIILTAVDKNEITDYNIKKLSSLGYIDASFLDGAVFRTRENGDRFRYPFAEHSKSLKNLFKEKNLTSEKRFGVPMLADKDNNILWINGIGVSAYGAVNKNTVKIAKINANIHER